MASGRRLGPRRTRVLVGVAAAPFSIMVFGAQLQSPSPGPTPMGVLVVTKTDAITQASLAGAGFRVFDMTDPATTVANLTTKQGGSDQTRLPVGPTYCLEETTVPQGYQLAPTYTPAAGCVSLKTSSPTLVSVTDPPSPTASVSPTLPPSPTPAPTATPSPTPTPAPTPAPTGELQVVKTDAAGQAVAAPGFTFDIHAGSPSGTVVATITTDTTGTAIAAALSPTTHCVEETGAADGYQLAPTYTPRACVIVTADPTNSASPARVTVADPLSGDAAAASTARPPLSPVHRAVTGLRSSTATISPAALVGFGAALLVIGLVMIAVGINRRHPGVAAR